MGLCSDRPLTSWQMEGLDLIIVDTINEEKKRNYYFHAFKSLWSLFIVAFNLISHIQSTLAFHEGAK